MPRAIIPLLPVLPLLVRFDCGGGPSGDPREKTLTGEVAGYTIEVAAEETYARHGGSGNHYCATPPSHGWTVDASMRLSRDGDPITLRHATGHFVYAGAGNTVTERSETGCTSCSDAGSREEMDEVFDRLAIEACGEDPRAPLLVRVLPDDPFRVVYVPDGGGEALVVEGASGDCAEVLRETPALDDFLDERLSGCDPLVLDWAAAHRLHLGRALGCRLFETERVPMAAVDDVLEEVIREGAAAEPDLEASLYAALTPRDDFPSAMANAKARKWIEAAPDPARRRAWFDAAAQACAETDERGCDRLVRWALVPAALRLGGAACDRMLARVERAYRGSGQWPTRDTRDALVACGSEEAVRRAMLAALAVPDPVRENVSTRCTGDDAQECHHPSLVAAAWLAEHCDEAAVDAARERLDPEDAWAVDAIGTEGRPHLRAHVEAVLRIVGACAPDEAGPVCGALATDDPARAAALVEDHPVCETHVDVGPAPPPEGPDTP